MKPLTDVNFWEENWGRASRPRKLRLYRDFDFETIRLLRDLAGTKGSWVLEVGAGASRVLPYLRRKFGYAVFGSDFSPRGCRLLRANLALQDIEGSVVCENLFQSSFPADKFDLVFSSGLIEHFDDPRGVVAEHLRLVKPGGRLALIVPNLRGVEGKIVQWLAPRLWSVHRVWEPDDLANFLKSFGLEEIDSGYLGSFLVHVGSDPEWTVVERWPGVVKHLVCDPVRTLNGLVSFFFRLAPLRPHSRLFSPACFAAGYKPKR